MNDARMKILEGLLRLRQICQPPAPGRAGSPRAASGKFETLLETLDTLRAEGHKALVFSQFVQMLTLVREELDARQIPYAYLDGQTKDRQARVDQFQNDPDLPFFLISLKAGGVGLNLTAADYVIHIDPWWNPAVEMQATDRTHRIGQDKPVFVYKMIARELGRRKDPATAGPQARPRQPAHLHRRAASSSPSPARTSRRCSSERPRRGITSLVGQRQSRPSLDLPKLGGDGRLRVRTVGHRRVNARARRGPLAR